MSNSCIQTWTVGTEATVNCIMGYNKQSCMKKRPKKDHQNNLKKRMMQILKSPTKPEKPDQTSGPSPKDSDRP